MRASVHANESPHQRKYADAMTAGLRRHGVDVVRAPFDTPRSQVDFAVVWGGRQEQIMMAGRPVLIIERGHVGAPPTMHKASYDAMSLPWISVGWNGVNGRGTYPECQDDGERWEQHHGHRMQPWRCGVAGYALIAGQIAGDASVRHIEFHAWAEECARTLNEFGHRVLYRPHPISVARNDLWRPRGAQMVPASATLQEDLAGAALVVTYNSGMGVDAVLAGIPTVAHDVGSMAWPVASYGLTTHLVMPEREPWAHRLAWAQWTLAEIENGDAWEVVRHEIPGQRRPKGCAGDSGEEMFITA